MEPAEPYVPEITVPQVLENPETWDVPKTVVVTAVLEVSNTPEEPR